MAYTTIKKPSDYFNTKLYTGNESTNAITGVGFQPDFVWMKNRDSAYYHGLYDSVRGTGNTKSLYSNADEAEGTNTGNMNLASFNSDGFTLGATSSTNIINKSSQNHASWNWKANGTGSANTDGTISSTVSANTTSGFSIVSYTGTGSNATVGHGLGVAPKMIIVKNLGAAESWFIYHKNLTSATHTINLNTTGAEFSNASTWNSTAPTSSVFSIGSDAGTNGSTNNMIAYCFADVQGYSKFGSYVGNGSNDGTFVYLGFKPAFLMVFAYQAGNENWMLVDSKRDGFNVENEQLFPNTSGAEESNDEVDLLSNGFKLRRNNSRMNGSNYPYIYITFAEEPLVGDNPATAR